MTALPDVTEDTRDFWEGGAQGELRIHRCRSCRQWFHPPAPVCPHCFSRDVGPEVASGLATVVAYTVNHHPWWPGMVVPYVVALVELNEQADVRLTTRLVDCAPDDVHFGLPVAVVFEPADDVWLPLFRPTSEGA